MSPSSDKWARLRTTYQGQPVICRLARPPRLHRYWATLFACLCVLAADTAHAQRRTDPAVRVPNVVGLQVEIAGQVVEKSGLRRGEIVYQRSAGPPGVVIDQSLKPGTPVQRGTLLNVIVSQAVEAIVPNVLRLSIPDAEVAIKNARLQRGEIRYQETGGPPGLVINQSLKPGLEVERGTVLHLTVSQAIPVVVPNVLRLSIPDAEIAIKNAQLQRGEIRYQQAPGPPGVVINQSL
jgi:beta-lactam-binding protein with PASTA domain